MERFAVITGDIIESTKLKAAERKKLLQNLDLFFKKFSSETENELNLKIPFEVFRGDSFQGMLETPEESLKICILLRSYLKSQYYSGQDLDARIAIGIGKVSFKSAKLSESDGEAFHNSGRLLDVLKKQPQKIGIQSPWKTVNDEINIGLILLEGIIGKWTSLQADVIYLKLLGMTEMTISSTLKIAQPAVNQRAKAASWTAVEAFIKRYKELIITKIK
ncbi:SatD family protein [Runella sp.]|uniref:SatD family protein n=1 Tax=Runella sp. TaxID=1960881 RepID=UPI003D0E9E21